MPAAASSVPPVRLQHTPQSARRPESTVGRLIAQAGSYRALQRTSSVPVPQFTRFDTYRQHILFRRKRAGGVGGKRARRVIGLIEIQDDVAAATTAWHFRVQEPTSRIRFLARGRILEDQKQR